MGGGIEAVRNEHAITIVLDRLVSLGDAGEFLTDGADQLEGRLDFFLGLVGLHHGADNCDVGVLLAYAVHG